MGELKDRYLKKQRDVSMISEKPPFPKIIKIDICNTCNYACVFCPQAKQSNKIGNIDVKLCKKIMEDARNAGATEICLSSTGEPLLNPMLSDYIAYAKLLGYNYIFFNTNGYLMDENIAKKIISAGIDSVKFSINASDKSYKLIHGAGSYKHVIENLRLFNRIRKETGSKCKLYVSFVATKYTYDEAEIVKKDTEAYCDDVIVMNANNRGGIADEVNDCLYYKDDEYSYQFPCSQIFNNIYVTAEGYMVACCQDFDNYMIVEDLNEKSVLEAWNGDNFTDFRRRFLHKDFQGILCENCLNNTHKPIVPLQDKYDRYFISEKKNDNLIKRIEELKNKEIF